MIIAKQELIDNMRDIPEDIDACLILLGHCDGFSGALLGNKDKLIGIITQYMKEEEIFRTILLSAINNIIGELHEKNN